MKILLLSFLFGQITYAQVSTERNYTFYNEGITIEKSYSIGYNGLKADTLLLETKLYDSLGRIIERRYNYNTTASLYESDYYVYEVNGNFCFSHKNPFILDGTWIEKYVINRQIFYHSYRNNIDYEIVEYSGGEKIRFEYFYDEIGLLQEVQEINQGVQVRKKIFIYS